ncbi:MAG: hypothetical protein NC548_51730 [Lachnospiraceae bacterium]|nr:hypothetical protein [Lachnospiraceae bacterium]
MYRELLQKIIGFDQWHLKTLNERFYVVPTIKRINGLIQDGEVSDGAIIEVGCGLGDIISAIRWKNRAGYDIDRKAILAARLLHPETLFRVGTFDEIRGRKIAVLIALNFLHRVDDSECDRYFNELILHNEVDIILVDKVQSPPYQYVHDYTKLFERLGYTLKYCSKGYLANERTTRKILYFVKADKRA